jgi:hypothetical protein
VSWEGRLFSKWDHEFESAFPPAESPSLSGFHPRFRVVWRRGVSRDPAARRRRHNGGKPGVFRRVTDCLRVHFWGINLDSNVINRLGAIDLKTRG